MIDVARLAEDGGAPIVRAGSPRPSAEGYFTSHDDLGAATGRARRAHAPATLIP